MERQVAELQAQVGDAENERALRKQLRKTRALLNDVQAQLEYEQNSSKSSNMVKTLRMQLEDAQMNEEAAHKQHRRLQNEYDELQTQNDDLIQVKMEVSIIKIMLSTRGGDVDIFLVCNYFEAKYHNYYDYCINCICIEWNCP